MRLLSLVLAAVGFIPLVACAQAQHSASDDPTRIVTVRGEGTVTVEPDVALVRFGVVAEAETAEAARAKNAEASKNAMNAVRALDVPEERIRMEQLQLRLRREYNRETRRQEEKGYEASRQVVVELDSLERLPALITRVVQQGANRLDGVQYDVSNRDAIRNDALRAAAQSAREKAQLLVETLGATLGPVQRIDEQNFDFPRPYARMEATAMKASADQAAPEPDAFAAGEIEVSATVQAAFQIE
jgi:uncharacterized protein YggE